MRVVKARLIDMMPEAKIFLDVDDLQRKKGKGAELVDGSQVFLLFCSQGFFMSPNCMREVLRGVLRGKKFLILLEPDLMHGRVTIEEAIKDLKFLEATKQYQEWGLDKEVEAWVNVKPTSDSWERTTIPTADEMIEILFQHEAVSWWQRGSRTIQINIWRVGACIGALGSRPVHCIVPCGLCASRVLASAGTGIGSDSFRTSRCS
jgi:hypothetical protein